MNDNGRKLNRCSFCGKTERQVHRMIQGPGVQICNECVHLCMGLLDDSVRMTWKLADLNRVFCQAKPASVGCRAFC